MINKKIFKTTTNLTKTGIGLSLTSSLVKDNEYSSQAIGKIASQMPTVANIQGTAMVVDSLKLLDPRRLKRK